MCLRLSARSAVGWLVDSVLAFEDIQRQHLALMRAVAAASMPNQSDRGPLPENTVVFGFRQRVGESGRLFGDPWIRQELRSILIFWGAYLSSMKLGYGGVRLADFENDEQLAETVAVRTRDTHDTKALTRSRPVSLWGAPREGVQLTPAGG